MYANLLNSISCGDIFQENTSWRINQFNTGFRTYFQNRIRIVRDDYNLRVGLNVNQRISFNWYLDQNIRNTLEDEGISVQDVSMVNIPSGYGIRLSKSSILNLQAKEYHSLDGQIYLRLLKKEAFSSTSLFASFLMEHTLIHNHDGIISRYSDDPYQINCVSLGIRRTDYSQREIYVKEMNRIVKLNVPYKAGMMSGFRFFYEDRLTRYWEREYRIVIFALISLNRGYKDKDEDLYRLHSLTNLIDYQAYSRKLDGTDYAYLNLLYRMQFGLILSGKFNYNWGTKFKIMLNLDFITYTCGGSRLRLGPDIYLVR